MAYPGCAHVASSLSDHNVSWKGARFEIGDVECTCIGRYARSNSGLKEVQQLHASLPWCSAELVVAPRTIFFKSIALKAL